MELAKETLDAIIARLGRNADEWNANMWTEADFRSFLGKKLQQSFREKGDKDLRVHFEVPIAKSSPLWRKEPEVGREIQSALKHGFKGRLDVVVHKHGSMPIFPVVVEVKWPLRLPPSRKTTWMHDYNLPKDVKRLKLLVEAGVCRFPYLVSVDWKLEGRDEIYQKLRKSSDVVSVVPIYVNNNP
jgi:hypothetical protein